MKKLLLFIFTLTFFSKTKAQVVFCPSGAEWRYSFYGNLIGTTSNEKITYVRDSVIGAETVKVLQHARFFQWVEIGIPLLTLIKQKGDTIFVRNKFTQHGWQVLYNFNAQPGHAWGNSLLGVNYTTSVDSVKNVIVNGFTLKRLYVRTHAVGIGIFATTMTERLGGNLFFTNFYDESESDGDYISGFLCYKDNVFGQMQFTSKPCDYSNPNGIDELVANEGNIRIYPNPVSDILNIEILSNFENRKLRLVNLLGEDVLSDGQIMKDQRLKIDVGELQNGIYFLRVFENGRLVGVEKVVKE
jgi:hypothetical protein